MADRDTLAVLAEELALALTPLTSAFGSPEALRDFLEELGWDFATVPAAVNTLKAPAEQSTALARDGQVSGAQIPQLLNSVRAAFESMSNLSTAGGVAADFRNEFPRQLVDYLLVEYLLGHQARWGQLLRALGIIRLETKPAQGGRPAYVHRTFALEDFSRLINDPLVFFRNAYRWGHSDFDGEKLVHSMHGLFEAWNWRVREQLVDPATLATLTAGALQPAETYDTSLRLLLIESADLGKLEAGVGLFLLPETATDKPGFALLPFASAGFDEELEIADRLLLGFRAAIDLTGGVGILVRPNRDIQFFAGLETGTASAVSGNLAIRLRLAQPGAPITVIGRPAASRLEFGGVSTEGGTRFHSGGKFEVFTEFGLQAGRIVIKPGAGEQDSFLSSLLPADGIQLTFDLVVGFSTTQGLYFGGSGGLEIALPAHIQLGPIEIMSALIAVRFRNGAIPIDLAATIKGDLGVFKATVENIGLTARFTFPPDRKGNLGPANLALEFRPPNGVGLVVDAGVVKGGGYLYLDFDRGEYAGALELTFSGFISLKAIGLINTKLPGGQPGFSMLIIITAEFNPGFQLGFGFTLTGVGGLIGVNRAVQLDPLALAVRTGAANNILFPTNVVENAPRILSDLRPIFPPQEGRFLIGPMAKIGWGTPTLVSLSLGIIIEIPGNVVILGRLRVNLPTEDAPLLLLQVTFIGAIEFEKRRIWFFASLYDSRILFITIDGEMGLLMDFSDSPNFVLSVGGFHPRFQAPALPFPEPRRIAISIINESFARIRAEGYFAVTSNSVQFGTRAEMFFGFDALSVEGYAVFDALFRFSPLFFIVEIATGFSVKVFGMGVWGVHLRGSLEGPAPWRVRGAASISLLFFDISVDVDFTFGERNNDTLEPIKVMRLIETEIAKPENWMATLPPSGQLLTSLREIGDTAELVLHPIGTLRISQRTAPLKLKLDRIGNQKTEDVSEVKLAVSAGALVERGSVRESFARAQYQDMDDAQKLSQPAFEKLESGIELGAGAQPWASGHAADRTVRYETIIVDSAFERFRVRFFVFWAGLFTHFRAGSALAKSELSLAAQKRKQPFDAKVELVGDQYAVARTRDNAVLGATTVFGSYAEAQQHLNEAVRSDPALRDQIHVVPRMEVNRAA